MRKAENSKIVVGLLNEAAKIIRERKEIHYSVLAFMLGRSPQWINSHRHVLTEMFDDIGYANGYFYVKELPQLLFEEGESNEEGSD